MRRICVLSPSACPEHACPTLAPSTQRSCLLAEGDVACPSSTDTKRVVGADITVTCGKCPCQVSATCTGFIEVFENVGCPAPGLANVVLHADAGVCTPSIAGEYGSYRWNGSIATQNCSVQPPKTPMLETQQKKTICCPP